MTLCNIIRTVMPSVLPFYAAAAAGLVLCVLIFAVLGRGEDYRSRKK